MPAFLSGAQTQRVEDLCLYFILSSFYNILYCQVINILWQPDDIVNNEVDTALLYNLSFAM